MKKEIPYSTAFLILGGSMMLVASLFFSGRYLYDYILHSRFEDERYNIQYIYGASATSDAIDTSYLAELLNLSQDSPTNIYAFSERHGEALLKQTPIFQEVHLKKKMPDALSVKYVLREPVASIGGYQNTVIDSSGVPFPLRPYFSPKNLPRIFLPDVTVEYGVSIVSKPLNQALFILHMLEGFTISLIDMRYVSAGSLGKRSITVVFQNEHSRHFVRLPVKEYQTALSNYLEMRGELLVQERDQQKEETVVDLRLPGYGYVSSLPVAKSIAEEEAS